MTDGSDASSESLDAIYGRRFGAEHLDSNQDVWVEIARWLQHLVPRDGAVLDIACDRGLFINNIVAARRVASDIRDVRSSLDSDVEFVLSDGLTLADRVAGGSLDCVFMSNYLEHLASSADVLRQLQVAATLLKPGGRVIVLQPNIKLVGPAYWDFLDHKTPLTDKSLVEAAEIAGFHTEQVIVRFLPYTTKSRLPQHPNLVRAYLALPLAWRFLGKQTLYVGRRIGGTPTSGVAS
jgi:SAM-dependent methyltransferase